MVSTHTKHDGRLDRPERKHFGYVVQEVSRLLRRSFDGAAQRYDLTLPQWRVIAQLSFSGGLSQSTLAGCIDTDPMTVSGLVERLEAKGMVVRVADPDDSRAKIVRITDKAKAMVEEMKALADDLFGEAFDGISEEDRETALKVLQQVSANLSKERAQGKEELV